MLAIVERTDRLGCILHKLNVILLANSCQFLYADRMSESVHRYTSLHSATSVLVVTLAIANLCILGKPLLDGIRRESHGALIDINEHWVRTNVREGVAGGNEGKRLSEHLIVTLHAREHKRHVEGIGTTYTNNCTLTSSVASHIILKTINKLAH